MDDGLTGVRCHSPQAFTELKACLYLAFFGESVANAVAEASAGLLAPPP